jgi:hypothetical protein
LDSAWIGRGAKQNKNFKNFSYKIGEVWKVLKNYENEYKSSLGGHRQKLISALNSAWIGGGAKPKKISKNFPKKLLRSGKS